MAVYSAARSLWLANDLPSSALSHLILSTKPDPAVNSSFKLGTAAQTAIGLSGLSAAHFHSLRTGIHQDVTVDARHAVLEFHSEMWYTLNDKLVGSTIWDDLAGVYKTKGNSFVRIHTNFPHHRQGILDMLQCEPTKEALTMALLEWNAVEFETEASNRKLCATALRSFEQWDNHPQGIALASTPPVTLIKIAEAPKRIVEGVHHRPLDGIRVLDLSRILAGPVCGRTLAAHGADVLLVTSPNLPDLPLLDIETSRGKRTTQLDLSGTDCETMASLVKEGDVFVQAYRPGGLAEKRFGPEDLANLRPGIVYGNLSAYGWDGPWKDRRGFDSLIQTATGFNVAESQTYAAYEGNTIATPLPPRPLPMQALDHAAGYLLAFGINTALCRTINEGGSWEVRVSLAAVGQWIRSLGQLAPEIGFGDGILMPPRVLPQSPEISALAVTWHQSLREMDGDIDNDAKRQKMTAIAHAARLSKTPVKVGEAPMRLDAHLPTWLSCK